MTVIAPRGLRDVVVADTEIGRVDGDAGFYQYRQYSAIDLAEHATFEQVWFLFARGHLPDDDELSEFVATITPLREVPPATMSLLHQVGQSLTSRGMLGGLRTVLSALGTGATPLWDATEADRQADALRVSAVTPTILAALHRISRGVNPVAPRPDLGVAANWLYMVTGEVADAALVRAVEKYLIATIDHGFNASTFTARVIASTGADVFSAVCGAIGAFSGPLHGGAPDRALEALDEIRSTGRDPAEWARDEIAHGRRIMGFGHAVYRTRDPRSEMLKGVALELGGATVEFAVDAEEKIVSALREAHPDRPRYANVEFYAGVVMDRCGLPREMFTPTFAVSRVVGWSANIVEQSAIRTIIRPDARYVGRPLTPATP